METSRDEQLSNALATLNDLIALMRGFDLDETAQFLAMAKLNLLMDLNGISDEELLALCEALESGDVGKKPRRRAGRKRATADLPGGVLGSRDILAALHARDRAGQ